MKNKTNLIIRSAAKIIMAIVFCALLTMAASAVAPHISNDVAMGQLENDDISWSLMQSWYMVQNALNTIKFIIFAVCGCSIGADVYKYFKTKGEN